MLAQFAQAFSRASPFRRGGESMEQARSLVACDQWTTHAHSLGSGACADGARPAPRSLPVRGHRIGDVAGLDQNPRCAVERRLGYCHTRGSSLSARRAQLADGYDDAVRASESRGLLFSSGLITVEAIVGILLAVPFAAAQSTDVLNLAPEGFDQAALVLGLAGFACICAWLYRLASNVT